MIAGRFRRYVDSSLQARLLTLVLLPILVVTPITIGFVVVWSHGYNRDQLLRRVSTDLVVAHDAFVRQQRDALDDLERLAQSHVLVSALDAGDGPRIRDLLAALKGTSGFDFLNITDPQGRWLFTDGPAGSARPSLMFQQVSTVGASQVGIEIYDAQALTSEAPALVDRVRVSIDTERAEERSSSEQRAMVIRALAPVRDIRGTLVALLDGGVAINRDIVLVDRMRDLVYGPNALVEGSVGALAIFLDDVSISTNLRSPQGERALGTRASTRVRDLVLGHGDDWVDRALLLDEWYISAYEPIVDSEGRRVGMLYTGFLERPYRDAYKNTLLVVIGMLALGIALAGGFALLGSRAIARPIASMAAVARGLRDGRDIRIGDLSTGGELAELARQFDQTLDLLKLRNEQVSRAAEQLEAKVDERTAELAQNNRRLMETISMLESTRRQLVASEKLAALGELTAGVAHEINNPLAIIQGNLEILRRELGDDVSVVETEVDLVLTQVTRMQSIVGKLLDYSRSSHDARSIEPIDVRAVVDDAVILAEHEAFARGIDIRVTHGAVTRVAIEPQELEQVMLNLLLNAVHFSPRDKSIVVETRVEDEDTAVIEVSDSGPGVAPEHQRRIFDPFFTTKDTGGTGLGLSVSYGIVRRYGGDIRVRSSASGGACFEVRLPMSAVATTRDERAA